MRKRRVRVTDLGVDATGRVEEEGGSRLRVTPTPGTLRTGRGQ